MSHANQVPVITLDGPGGTGKGTVGQLLATELGWHYLDSGALYRALALASLQQTVAEDDEVALADLAARLDIRFQDDLKLGQHRLLLQGKDISEAIRSEACGNRASKIAALPRVRQALLALQRRFRQPPGLVTDGRDMGSVVFPDAPLKIFLEASSEERARRRYQQLKQKGISVSLAQLCAELAERDRRDRERQIAPLKPAEDAYVIDTTHLNITEVLALVKQKAREVLHIA